VVAAGRALVNLLGCPDLTVPDAVTALCPHLASWLTRPLRGALAAAADAVVAEHAAVHGCDRPAPSSLTAGVAAAVDAAQRLGNLDQTIATLVADGIDAERVTWDVISRESVRHEGLIFKEANRLVRTLPDRTADELTGYGWAGLRVALRNYDPDLGFAFSTYACPKINGAIRDGVRAESPIPKRLTTFVRKVSAAEEKLTHALSRVPTYAEIAAYVDSTAEAMDLLPRLVPTASLEELAESPTGERGREPACLVDDADPQEAAIVAMRDAALHRAIDALPPEEAQAVRLLLLEEVPIGKAAAMLGVEARQLRARRQRALLALEPVMRAWMDEHVTAVA
jgi:RNA polymerase sigma factor for flagellar operon FliA